jgi:hypothetical protein
MYFTATSYAVIITLFAIQPSTYDTAISNLWAVVRTDQNLPFPGSQDILLMRSTVNWIPKQ